MTVERRLHTRHNATTRVRVSVKGGQTKVCKAVNLSADGCLIATGDMGLRKGIRATLTFLVNLGTVTKLHVRIATVAHVTRGCTGFHMERYDQKT